MRLVVHCCAVSEEPGGAEDEASGDQDEAVFGLVGAGVAAGEGDDDAVAEGAGDGLGDYGLDERGDVGETDLGCGHVVGGCGEEDPVDVAEGDGECYRCAPGEEGPEHWGVEEAGISDQYHGGYKDTYGRHTG